MNKALLDEFVELPRLTNAQELDLIEEIEKVTEEAKDLPQTGDLPEEWVEYLDQLETVLMTAGLAPEVFDTVQIMTDADDRMDAQIGVVASGLDLVSPIPPMNDPNRAAFDQEMINLIKQSGTQSSSN